MIPKFLIISLFQTLMIFQQTIYQNFIHILIISQYDSQKLHLQDHPIRLRQWCIYIYIQRKLSLRESATTNKFWTAWEMLQPMLRQIGWHCILAKICSQRISFQRRSRLNQCTSSITQHVTPACYSTLRHSITYLHAIRGYPLFHTQKEIDDGAILLKKLYVSRSSNIQWWHAKGQVYFFIAWYGKNGDGFPTNLRFRNPFQICSFLLLQPRHMIYLNVHALRTQNNPVRRLVAR